MNLIGMHYSVKVFYAVINHKLSPMISLLTYIITTLRVTPKDNF